MKHVVCCKREHPLLPVSKPCGLLQVKTPFAATPADLKTNILIFGGEQVITTTTKGNVPISICCFDIFSSNLRAVLTYDSPSRALA